MERDVTPAPPFDQVRIYENALPVRVFEELQALVSKIEHEGSDYCSKENTGWWALGGPRSLAELVGSFLLPYAEESYQHDDECGSRSRRSPHLVGAEWWVRLTDVDEEHDPHFDKDETRWENTGNGEFEGEMVHPFYGSILYLGDEGGPTVIVDQRAITEGVKVVALEPALEDTLSCRAHVIEPKPNQYVVFPGWARHWVVAAEGEGSRRTLLYNWWCKEPWEMPKTKTLIPGEKP